jgi:hypothetical protein
MEIVLNALMSVQDKHVDYFFENHKTIVDYVNIDWERPFAITYKSDHTLPPYIVNDIEQTFDQLHIF